MGIVERLTEIRNELGSNAELARAAGVSRSNVTQWLAGDINGLKAVTAIMLEEKTGFSARWIVLGRLPKKKSQDAGINQASATNDSSRTDPKSDAQKLVEIVRVFSETDAKGKDAIWAGARVAMKRATRQHRGRTGSVNTG